MPDKLKTARVCLLIQGWLSVIATIIMAVVFTLLALGLGFSEQGDANIAGLGFGIAGVVFVIIGAIFSYVYFLAAKGLTNKKEWSKVLSIVLAIIALVNFPIGTILGVLILIGVLDEGAMTWFGPQNQ
jgi:hypothetical protein